nr:hypothetical protein [Goodfellowiella coeruleoviolacea]
MSDSSTWTDVDRWFRRWAQHPALRAELRSYLRKLPADRAAAMIARSRETTTHFAWCLQDEPGDPFSLWLHEYKPWHDWRPGYADSVHNHRYHFCTTILYGSYVHERFAVELDAGGQRVNSATRTHSSTWHAGATGSLLSHEFHRIPVVSNGTMTFLVKSRPVTSWSLSFDPETRTSRRHVPVEARLGELIDRL